MKKHLGKLKDLWERDPWLVVKYVAGTVVLGCLSKGIMIAAKNNVDMSTFFVQFAPAPIMVFPTFLVHKYLWKKPETCLVSQVGGFWSTSYGTQFLAGHTAFTVFAVMLGYQYLAVSVIVGMICGIVTFFVNSRLFVERKVETSTP